VSEGFSDDSGHASALFFDSRSFIAGFIKLKLLGDEMFRFRVSTF